MNEEEAKEKVSLEQSNRSLKVKNRKKITKEYLREKGFSEEEIRLKTLTPSNKEFWIQKGYNEEESIELVKKNQSYASSKVDNKKIVRSNKLEYWINKGYNEVDAKEKLKERQSTFSFEKCIEKYGEEEGVRIFKERQEKWQKSLSENGNMKSGFSKISQELFENIMKNYDEFEKEFVFFSKKNREFALNDKSSKKTYLYDFTDIKKKKIIEFNGDIFHANPDFFNKDDNPNPYKRHLTSEDIWKMDEDKKNSIKELGYEILYIWDSEYKKDKDGTLKKCLQFLNIC